MRIREIIPEASPDTPEGSVSRDLMRSKLWLCKTLQELTLTKFDNIYILGSWYGALALIIKRLDFGYHNIYCVDSDREKADYFANLVDQHNLQGIHSVCEPAEDLHYRGRDILVVNTSTNDITGVAWLDQVPSGSVVAIQGRDNQAQSNGIETLDDFDAEYPLEQTFVVDSITVSGVDGEAYRRFMMIGRR